MKKQQKKILVTLMRGRMDGTVKFTKEGLDYLKTGKLPNKNATPRQSV